MKDSQDSQDSQDTRIGIGDTNPLWTLTFGDASGDTVGRMHVTLEGQITFEGDVDASALKFADTMNDLIESRRKRGVTLRIGNEPYDPARMTFRTYLRLPLIVEAIQLPQVFDINNSEGMHQGSPGDFLVRDLEGELHAVASEAFGRSHVRWYYYPDAYNHIVYRLTSSLRSHVIEEHPELTTMLTDAMRLLEEVCKKLKES